jgi:hypothetical protein
MKAEMFFMFMVVDIEAETKQNIRDASEEKLKLMTDLLSSGGEAFNIFNGGFAGGQVVAQTSSGLSLKANPYTRVRQDVKKIAAELLEAPQNEKYVLECDKRDAFEREAVVASVVAMLDKKLFFSDDQRSAISEELTKNWAKAFDVNLETYQNSPAYVPDIPFVRIDKILNRDQRKLWQGLQKYTFPIVIGTEQQPVEWDE